MPSTQIECSIGDLLAGQTDVNPHILAHQVGGNYAQRRTVLQSSLTADVFFIDFAAVDAVQIDTIIGETLLYTVFSWATR